MTKKQRREYKAANQRRRLNIIDRLDKGPKQERCWWAKSVGVIQQGK